MSFVFLFSQNITSFTIRSVSGTQFFIKEYAAFDFKIFFQTTDTHSTSFMLAGEYFIYKKVFTISFVFLKWS